MSDDKEIFDPETAENGEDCIIEEYTLTDEEGNETKFELIGTIELDNKKYVALIPSGDEESDEYVVLRIENEDGEEVFVTIDDDDEFDAVADKFEDIFMGEFDCDENDLHVEDEE